MKENPWLEPARARVDAWPDYWRGEHQKEFQRQRHDFAQTDDVAFIMAMRVIERRRYRETQAAFHHEMQLERGLNAET